ncbi:MAG: hypothetical protein MJH11_20850, partial [Lentisphaeria bacterium]|nr:hypothetical protein [Lentisphaeria bacterium]
MTDLEQTKPSPMIRIADLLYRLVKAARRRWYVTLASWPAAITSVNFAVSECFSWLLRCFPWHIR